MKVKGLNDLMYGKVILIWICLLIVGIIPLELQAATYPITWSPNSIGKTIGLGGTADQTITFNSSKKLSNISLWVVPELQPFVSVSPNYFGTINANVTHQVSVRFAIPYGSKTGLRDGTIQIKQGSTTSPNTLKVKLNIVDAAGTVGPGGGAIAVTDPVSPIYGVKVEIPTNSLINDTVVSISKADINISFPEKIEGVLVSPVIRVEPSDVISQGSSFKIIIPYKDEDNDGKIDGTDFLEDFIQVYTKPNDTVDEFWMHDNYIVDKANNQVVIFTDHFSYWLANYQRWVRWTNVTYSIQFSPVNCIASSDSSGNFQYCDEGRFKEEIRLAFDKWKKALGTVNGMDVLTFTEFQPDPANPNYQPDIVIRTVDFCTNPTIGKCEWYGSTTDPTKEAQSRYISFNFNNDPGFSNWWVVDTYGNYCEFPPHIWLEVPQQGRLVPFLRIALHEIGHALGLGDFTTLADEANYQYPQCGISPDFNHCFYSYCSCINMYCDNKRIMYKDCFDRSYPTTQYPFPFTELSLTDINAIRKLYELDPIPPTPTAPSFDFAMSLFAVDGNLHCSGMGPDGVFDFFDNFNDGSLTTPPTSYFRFDQPIEESNGFLKFRSADGYYSTSRYGYQYLLDLAILRYPLRDQCGNSEVIGVFRADPPEQVGQFYGIGIENLGSAVRESVGIVVSKRADGRIVVGVNDHTGTTLAGDIITNPPCEFIIFKLFVDDASNQVYASYSTDNGVTYKNDTEFAFYSGRHGTVFSGTPAPWVYAFAQGGIRF